MSPELNSGTTEMPSGRGSSRLTPERVEELAELLIAGCTRVETAEALGVTVRTVSRWKKDPRVLIEVERLRNRTDEELAIDSLKHLLGSDNERIALGAAQALMRVNQRSRLGDSKPESAQHPLSPDKRREQHEEMALIEEGPQWHEAFSGAVYSDEVLTLNPAFPDEIRGKIQNFLAAKPDAATAQWTASKAFAPMTWRFDGQPYSPIGLVNKIRVAAGLEPVAGLAGVGDYWRLPNGVLISDQPKFVSRYELTSS